MGIERPPPGWGAALALAGGIFAALLALAGRTTLWDRDEPRFAQATVEMIASGDYLVPTFNGQLRPDKPVLVYWLMSLPMRLLGPTAVAARLWSAAGIALSALFTFAIARRLLSARAGLWAMAVLAASPLAAMEGLAATADAVLLAAVTAALACFAAALAGGGGRPWPWLGLGVALGLALLAKGPVGLAVPGLAIATALWLLWRGRPRSGAQARPAEEAGSGFSQAQQPACEGGSVPVPPMRVPPRQAGVAPLSPTQRQPDEEGGIFPTQRPPDEGGGIPSAQAESHHEPAAIPIGRYAALAALAALLGLAIFGAWGVPANLATGGELARLGLGKHVVGRALGAMEGHGGGGWRGWLAGLPFYLLVAWVGFAPWVLWLPAAVSAALGGRLGGERGRALWIGWVVPTFVLMAVVSTRLPHYVLPAWPALALAVGGTLEAERSGGLAPRDRRWLRRGGWLLAPLLALAAAAVAALAVVAVLGRLPQTAAEPRDSTAASQAARPAGATAGSAAAVVGSAATAASPAADEPAAAGSATPGTEGGLVRDLGGLVAPWLALGVVMAVAGGRALCDHLAGRTRRAAAVLLVGTLAAALVAGAALAPALERQKPAPALAAAVRAATAPSVPVATFEYAEPSFIFYLRRWPVRELPDESAVASWAAERSPGVLVLPRSTWRRLRGAPWAAGLDEIAAARGWNVAKGRPLDLLAVRRHEAR